MGPAVELTFGVLPGRLLFLVSESVAPSVILSCPSAARVCRCVTSAFMSREHSLRGVEWSEVSILE